MCILFIAVKQHPDYPLIIAANRDEFHNRPTHTSSFWADHPQLLAGKDLRAGGTWMGINRNGRLSALTNVRDPQKINPDAISRGELVTHYLLGSDDNDKYLERLKASKHLYNGYNLLFGPWHDLSVYNNHTDEVHGLVPGVYGLSNANLNSPWPKINNGVNKLKYHCQQATPLNTDTLFSILLDQTRTTDDLLPQTGVPIEWERKLSSIFIQSEEYGTRSSTLLLIDKHHQAHWQEHTFANNGQVVEHKSFNFALI